MRSDQSDSAEANPRGIEVGRLGEVNRGTGEQGNKSDIRRMEDGKRGRKSEEVGSEECRR
jgi:hypothetical protein